MTAQGVTYESLSPYLSCPSALANLQVQRNDSTCGEKKKIHEHAKCSRPSTRRNYKLNDHIFSFTTFEHYIEHDRVHVIYLHTVVINFANTGQSFYFGCLQWRCRLLKISVLRDGILLIEPIICRSSFCSPCSISYSWYHGKITKQEAYNLLMTGTIPLCLSLGQSY